VVILSGRRVGQVKIRVGEVITLGGDCVKSGVSHVPVFGFGHRPCFGSSPRQVRWVVWLGVIRPSFRLAVIGRRLDLILCLVISGPGRKWAGGGAGGQVGLVIWLLVGWGWRSGAALRGVTKVFFLVAAVGGPRKTFIFVAAVGGPGFCFTFVAAVGGPGFFSLLSPPWVGKDFCSTFVAAVGGQGICFTFVAAVGGPVHFLTHIHIYIPPHRCV
jgi:hypothetical protein